MAAPKTRVTFEVAGHVFRCFAKRVKGRGKGRGSFRAYCAREVVEKKKEEKGKKGRPATLISPPGVKPDLAPGFSERRKLAEYRAARKQFEKDVLTLYTRGYLSFDDAQRKIEEYPPFVSSQAPQASSIWGLGPSRRRSRRRR